MRGPVLICGCPGSGTSFVTKVLRYAGMFSGADSGPLDARKFHESKSFRDANKRFLIETTGISYSPKGVLQFAEHVDRVRKQLKQLVQLVDKTELLKTYWGKYPVAGVWGWKDPRNSANSIIWREIFPDLRVLTIRRRWEKKMRRQKTGSVAGEWFRHESSTNLREMYTHPPGVEGLESHVVDFDRLLTESTELETLLQWMGLSTGPARRFLTFLSEVGVEK